MHESLKNLEDHKRCKAVDKKLLRWVNPVAVVIVIVLIIMSLDVIANVVDVEVLGNDFAYVARAVEKNLRSSLSSILSGLRLWHVNCATQPAHHNMFVRLVLPVYTIRLSLIFAICPAFHQIAMVSHFFFAKRPKSKQTVASGAPSVRGRLPGPTNRRK